MKEAPERVARNCFEFLGVSEEIASIHLDSAKNRRYRTSWVGRRINRLAFYPSLRTALKPVVPRSIVNVLYSVMASSEPVPAMKEGDKMFLTEYFRERNQKLERLIGMSLERWRL